MTNPRYFFKLTKEKDDEEENLNDIFVDGVKEEEIKQGTVWAMQAVDVEEKENGDKFVGFKLVPIKLLQQKPTNNSKIIMPGRRN